MNNMKIDKINEIFNEFKLIDTQISNNVKKIYGAYEVWKKIKNYDNYSVSSFGRIRNDKFNRFMNPSKTTRGYIHIRLSKNGKVKNYQVHRLVGIAFLPNHDNKPKVDHIDKDKTNNNIINLRFATVSQNGFNQGKCKNNTTGYKGVTFKKANQKYCARIKIEGKSKHLGYFETAQDASKAYEENAKNLHGEFYYKN